TTETKCVAARVRCGRKTTTPPARRVAGGVGKTLSPRRLSRGRFAGGGVAGQREDGGRHEDEVGQGNRGGGGRLEAAEQPALLVVDACREVEFVRIASQPAVAEGQAPQLFVDDG